MSYRRLHVLLDHLPLDSATRTVLRDIPRDTEPEPPTADGESKFGPWALINYQLAGITDALKSLTYYTAAAVTKDPPKPQPTPHPGATATIRRLGQRAAERLAHLHPGR